MVGGGEWTNKEEANHISSFAADSCDLRTYTYTTSYLQMFLSPQNHFTEILVGASYECSIHDSMLVVLSKILIIKV